MLDIEEETSVRFLMGIVTVLQLISPKCRNPAVTVPDAFDTGGSPVVGVFALKARKKGWPATRK